MNCSVLSGFISTPLQLGNNRVGGFYFGNKLMGGNACSNRHETELQNAILPVFT